MRKEIQNILDHNTIPPNSHKRFDCPFCGGEHTLAIYRDVSHLSWYCFRASCGSTGGDRQPLSLDDIQKLKQERKTPVFQIPEYWTNPNRKTIEYLKSVNAIEAYTAGRIDVRYDPRLDRQVFVLWSTSGPVGAIGRGDAPKWHFYHQRLTVPYLAPRYGTYMTPRRKESWAYGIIVEDAASAAAVSKYTNGIALLGTRLPEEYISFFRGHDRLYVCLDKDATPKALEIAKTLTAFACPTRVVPLEEDIKDMSKEGLYYFITNKQYFP